MKRPPARTTVGMEWWREYMAMVASLPKPPPIPEPPPTPHFQQLAADYLEKKRQSVLPELVELEQKFLKDRNLQHLFEAVHLCRYAQLPLQEWAAVPMLIAYRKVRECEVDSWDDALGRPYPKDFKTAHYRERYAISQAVYFWIIASRRKNPKKTLDDLYKEAGEAFGIGEKQCAQIYRRARGKRKKAEKI
jgi:hypothetical protein